jgi:hypothetical protein
MSDWRFDNLKHLRGVSFRFATYKKPSDEWNHDHCRGCWGKFAEFDSPDILREGFVYSEPAKVESPKPLRDTFREFGLPPELAEAPERHLSVVSNEPEMRIIGQPRVNGYLLHWVCPECFRAFQDALEFRLM